MKKNLLFGSRIAFGLLSTLAFTPAPALAGNGCGAGGIETKREVIQTASKIDTRIFCRRIANLSANEIKRLSPDAMSVLTSSDLAALRDIAGGFGLFISPSLILSLEERDFLTKQLDALQVRRTRAENELARVRASRATIDQEARENAAVIRDLNADVLVHSLEALDLVLVGMNGKISAAQMIKLHSTIRFARLIGNALAASTSERQTDRLGLKLAQTFNALKNLLPATAVGMNPEELEAIKRATDTFPKLAEISQKIADTPRDKQVWSEWASCVDDWLEVVSKVHPAAVGLYSSGQLIDELFYTLPQLRRDADTLRAAGVSSQTAQRYWISRIGEIDDLQRIYQVRLGLGEMNNVGAP